MCCAAACQSALCDRKISLLIAVPHSTQVATIGELSPFHVLTTSWPVFIANSTQQRQGIIPPLPCHVVGATNKMYNRRRSVMNFGQLVVDVRSMARSVGMNQSSRVSAATSRFPTKKYQMKNPPCFLRIPRAACQSRQRQIISWR